MEENPGMGFYLKPTEHKTHRGENIQTITEHCWLNGAGGTTRDKFCKIQCRAN